MIRGLLSTLLFVAAFLCAVVFVVVQSVDDTRNGAAAQITQPIPAICMSVLCFVCCSSLRLSKKERPSMAHQTRRMCQVDTWCVLFGVALALFAVGDATLLVHNQTYKTAGIAVFATGQILLMCAMCLPREVGDPKQQVLPRVGLLYGTMGLAFWLAVFFATSSSGTCGASASTAAYVATYLLAVVAVAWRSVDILATTFQVGSVWIVLGAHLFLLSEFMAALESLCGVFAASGYYPLVLTTYFIAIILEARGVTKYALETDYVLLQTETYTV